MELFDRYGQAICYVTNNSRLYAWDGRPLGVISGDKVHTYSGKFVGWLRHGYLINQRMECCLFTIGADRTKGPIPPNRKPRPPKGERQLMPDLASRSPAPPFRGVLPDWGKNPFRPTMLSQISKFLTRNKGMAPETPAEI